MEEEIENIIEKADLNDQQNEIMEICSSFTNMMRIKLSDQDMLNLIYFIESVNGNELLDTRYGLFNTIGVHPKLVAIQKKYTKEALKELRKTDKKKYRKAIQGQKSEIIKIKNIFKYSNNVLMIISKLFLYLQMSIESYQFSQETFINILDLEAFDKVDFNNPYYNLKLSVVFNERSLNYLIDLLEKVTEIKSSRGKYASDKKTNYWDFISDFLKDKTIVIKDHVMNTVKELLKYYSIKTSILEKIIYLKRDNSRNYLKKGWETFKPLKENKIIDNINKNLEIIYNETIIMEKNTRSNIIKKDNKGEDILENICGITSIGNYLEKHKLLKIPVNLQYKYNCLMDIKYYTNFLLGKENEELNEDNKRFFKKLLMNLYNLSIEDNELEKYGRSIETILRNAKWTENPATIDKFKNRHIRDISYSLERLFPNDCLERNVFINDNSAHIFKLVINSPDNVRRYKYIEYPIVPEELDGNQKSVLYNQYCYILDEDENKHILKRVDDKIFYNDLILANNDISIDSLICNNFKGDEYLEILEFKQKSLITEKDISDIDVISGEIEYIRRAIKFIEANDYTNADGNDILTEIYELYNDIVNDKDSNYKNPKLYKELIDNLDIFYNSLLEKCEEFKENLNEYLPDYIIKQLEDITEIDENENYKVMTRILYNYINNNIKIVLCRLKNSKNVETSFKNNKIPTEWKMDPTKKEIYQKYLTGQEFSQYTFKQKRGKKKRFMENNSLYKWYDCINGHEAMTGFFSFIYKEICDYIKCLDILVGNPKKDTFFTEEYAYYFAKYVFYLVLSRIVSLINLLKEDEVETGEDTIRIKQNIGDLRSIIKDSEEIYGILNINPRSEDPEESIIKQLLIDLIYNISLEDNETENIRMYYNEEKLNEIISKEKEREKVSIVDKLTTMNHEKRGIEIQMQEMGIRNMYKSKEAENLEWIQSEAYLEFRMAERDKLQDPALVDMDSLDDLIGQEEHNRETEMELNRMEATDNMEDLEGDGYDNGDFADDETEN